MMFNARDLATMPKSDLWNLPDGPMKVVFDDGVLETYTRATVYSAYMWGFYAKYPKTPALMSHHLGKARVGGDTHMELLNRVLWDCYDTYLWAGEELDLESMSKDIYEYTNQIYNDFTYRLEANVRSINITHFIQVIHHPKIRAANDSVIEDNRLSIEQAWRTIEKVLKDPKELIDNPVAKAAKNGLVSMMQIRQCVGPRGPVTDVDSNYFKHPVTRGYVHGLRSLEDSMKESRSAAKSALFTEKPLQDTEYFNRQLQLLCDTVERVHPGDCGTEGYVEWRVRAGDLKDLAGKYYITDQGLKRVDVKDDWLKGEVIKLRSVLQCDHPDPRGVCSVCMGALALSIPRYTCIGHVSATALCEQVTQSVLSVKHVDSASGVDGIELSEYDQQYLKVGADPNQLLLADRLSNRRVLLTVSAKEAELLSDIMYVEDVRTLPIARITEITEIQLTIIGKEREATVTLPVAIGNRKGSFTHELLDYIKEHNWTLTRTGNYQFDLTQWNTLQPLFELPRKHENMLDYMATIERFIKATSEGSNGHRTLRDCPTYESALMEFHTLVASQLSVNIAHLEVIIKATTVRSSVDHDYRLPKYGNKVEFATFNELMNNRSMTVPMAFQDQKKVLLDPASYVYKHRPSHPMDPLLIPGSGE